MQRLRRLAEIPGILAHRQIQIVQERVGLKQLDSTAVRQMGEVGWRPAYRQEKEPQQLHARFSVVVLSEEELQARETKRLGDNLGEKLLVFRQVLLDGGIFVRPHIL